MSTSIFYIGYSFHLHDGDLRFSGQWKYNSLLVRHNLSFKAGAECVHHLFKDKWPISHGDVDLSVMEEVVSVCYVWVDLLLVKFLYCNMWLVLGCILNGGAVNHLTTWILRNENSSVASVDSFVKYNYGLLSGKNWDYGLLIMREM